ncbi:Release factor glutamine methyltransferase [Oligella sp. MSHR50489EDL]|uniref:peptide chain release factor N(5)-glutamine methyltransferase n=1 Tax=Oligella sp. MSHR50489EDL TaxID=3139409 RepID=UPI003D819DD0
MTKSLDDCRSIKDVLTLQQLPLLERRMLLEFVFDKPRAWFISHDDELLSTEMKARLQSLFERRLAGEPLAYLIAQREFMSLKFKVSPAVLIPRPETELLVERAIAFLENLKARGMSRARVLDIGTGSGIIAISIKHYFPEAEVWAVDLSADALTIARENAQNLNADIQFIQSDLFEAFKSLENGFDLIVSNPPYIDRDDRHLQQGDVRFEPLMALTDYADGLTLIRRLIQAAPQFLKSNSSAKALETALWLEHGWDQAAAVRALLTQQGFKQVQSLQDLAGIERISGGLLGLNA